MKWYGRMAKLAARPPAYIVERISDLRHASDLSKAAPREAQGLIHRVISQLTNHHDDEFADKLKEAAGRVLDNPIAARTIIDRVIAAMDKAKSDEGKPKWPKMKFK